MGWIILVLLVLGVILLVSGLIRVEEQERKVVELFGKYCMTLKPGLQWLLPGAMKVKAIISVMEQEIPLFSDSPASLDLKDGTIVPQGAKVFVKLRDPDKPYMVVKIPDGPDKKKPDKSYEIVYDKVDDGKLETGVYRAIYEVPDWKEFIEDRIENALRSHLNELTIDGVLTAAKAGFNLVNHSPDAGLSNEQLDAIEGDLALWGFDLLRITITDFQLPEEIIKARDAVQIRRREAEAAPFQAEREAEETGGAVIQMFCKMTGMSRKKVEKALRENPEEFVKRYQSFWEKAWDTIYRKMGIDGKAYLDIRTQNPLLDLVTLFKSLPLTNPPKEESGAKVKMAEAITEKTEDRELTEEDVVEEANKKGLDPKRELKKWREWKLIEKEVIWEAKTRGVDPKDILKWRRQLYEEKEKNKIERKKKLGF